MVPAKSIVPCAFLSVTLILGAVCFVSAQTPSNPALPSHVDFKVDYPKDQPGVFIQSADWLSLASVMPTKSRAKGLFAASLSYGAIPANLVAEYEGLHASTQIQPGRPVICLCHMISLPGNPVIVRLQPKKNSRELDGGKMTVKPIVEGSKIVDAKKSDLIPVKISQPENTVWLVRPQRNFRQANMRSSGNAKRQHLPVTAKSSTQDLPSDSEKK